MRTWRTITLTLVIATVAIPLIAGLTAWLPPVIQTGVFVLVPAMAVAAALVVYFNWRGGLRARIGTDGPNDDQFLTAA